MLIELRHLAAGIALGEAAKGVREDKPNWSPEIALYLADAGLTDPEPYCAAGCHWCVHGAAKLLGVGDPLIDVRLRGLVMSYVAWAQRAGKTVAVADADTGDLICYAFGAPGHWDHMEIIIQPPGHGVTVGTVGFNTSDPNDTNPAHQREGVGVFMRKRYLGRQPYTIIRY